MPETCLQGGCILKGGKLYEVVVAKAAIQEEEPSQGIACYIMVLSGCTSLHNLCVLVSRSNQNSKAWQNFQHLIPELGSWVL